MRRLLNCIGSRRSSIRCASFAAGLFHFKIVPEELFPFPTYNLEEDEADNLDTLTGKVKEGEKVDGLLAGARIAAEYGGLGLKNTAYCLACEEIGRRGADEELLFAIQSSSFPVHVLTAFGSKETKGKHLTLMSDGTERFGWAVQEDHGSDVSMNTTRARVENDKYILTGKKCCRPLPERATHFLVLARTKTQILGEDGPQESDRSSLFIVDRNAKGVRVEGESVVLEEVEVEAEDIVGTVGEGFRNYVIAHLTEQYALSATLLGTLKACCEEISKSGEDPHNNGILGSCIASIYMVESALHALTANLDRHVEDILLESCFTSSLIYQTAQKCFSMLSTVAPLSSTYYKSYTTLLRMMEHPDYLFGAGVTSGVEEYGLDFQQTSTLQIMIRRTGRMVGMRDKLPVREISGCEKIDKAIVNFGNAVETTFIQNTTSLPYQQLLVNRLGEAGALLYAASATASRAAYAVKKMQASAKAEKHLASVVIAGATDRVNVLCEAAQNTGMTADDICKRIALELCDEAAKAGSRACTDDKPGGQAQRCAGCSSLPKVSKIFVIVHVLLFLSSAFLLFLRLPFFFFYCRPQQAERRYGARLTLLRCNLSDLLLLLTPYHMLRQTTLLSMRHIGQDVPKRHTHFVLESRLMYEKSFRDEWLRSLCNAVANIDEPIASSVAPLRQQMLQRKVACFQYNQFGLFTTPYYRLANVDRYYAVQGTLGTREWVPYANISSWTMNKMVRSGNILVHRVYYRGWGTCKHLNQGGWEHRWNKVMQRNVLQYTRI